MPENECPSPPSRARFTQRKAPFGRRSISQTASGTLLGSHQCVTCSALVQASKTRALGASKVRVITIWLSPGVVIVTGPMLFTSALCLSLLPSTCFLLFLHLFQVPVQACEFLFPEAAKRIDPVSNVLKRDGHEGAWTPLCLARAPDEARAFKDTEVLGDCRLAQVEGLHEFGNICVAGSKASQDRPPGGICERCKD